MQYMMILLCNLHNISTLNDALCSSASSHENSIPYKHTVVSPALLVIHVNAVTLNTGITVSLLRSYIDNIIFNSARFVERYKSH